MPLRTAVGLQGSITTEQLASFRALRNAAFPERRDYLAAGGEPTDRRRKSRYFVVGHTNCFTAMDISLTKSGSHETRLSEDNTKRARDSRRRAQKHCRHFRRLIGHSVFSDDGGYFYAGRRLQVVIGR